MLQRYKDDIQVPKFIKYKFVIGLLLCGLSLLSPIGCQSDYGNPPSGKTVWIEPNETRLIFTMPELKQSQIRVRRYTSDDGKHIEELGEWYRFDKSTFAGLLLSQSAEGPPLNDPQDPMDIVGRWAVFRDQKPSFGILKKSNNILGPIIWRRTGIGTRTCVVFLQRWSLEKRSTNSAPITSLSGYYCNTPGEVFSPSLAKKTVKSIGLGQKIQPTLP